MKVNSTLSGVDVCASIFGFASSYHNSFFQLGVVGKLYGLAVGQYKWWLCVLTNILFTRVHTWKGTEVHLCLSKCTQLFITYVHKLSALY